MQLPITLAIHRSRLLPRLLCRGDVVALRLRTDGLIDIQREDGSLAEAVVHPQTTVFPWLVVLLYRVEGRPESLAIPCAAMDADAHRQLRLWLKWKASAQA